MSSIRLGTLDPGGGDPLDPEERQGQTMPETVVQAQPGQAPSPAGPTVGPDGKWDMGYTMPIPKPGSGPVPVYDEDRDYDGLPADSQKAALTVAHTDAEKEANFNSLRSMFGLGPDSAAKAQPHPVSPDANAPRDSEEFKSWLRSAPHEEFQRWIDGEGRQGLPASAVQPTPTLPAPTEAAVAQARAALGPPMSAAEMSQRAAQMPSPPPRPLSAAAPLPADPTQAAAVSDARRYQAATGQLNPYEQALMLKELAKKYAVKEPEKSYYPSQEQVAHANERARAGGTYGALTPTENAEMIKGLLEKYKPQPAVERAYNALPGGTLAQYKESESQLTAPHVDMARSGVGAAYPPTMVNDLAGRGWKVTPQGFDEGAPIVSPEEQARQIGELLKRQTPEQAKASRDKAFLDALNGR